MIFIVNQNNYLCFQKEVCDLTKINKEKTAPLNPGWIGKYPKGYADKAEFCKIIQFYVLRTPCTGVSYQGVEISKYGWNKKTVWQNDNVLKNTLMNIADMRRGKNFILSKKIESIVQDLNKADLNSKFQERRENQKFVFYKDYKYPNEFMSLFYHIRNSLAHGRFSIYLSKMGETMYVLESGNKSANKRDTVLNIRARIIVKESTLLKWISIIEKGPSR